MNSISRSGFTLIELLVVVSIVGMLSSIVLVAVNGVRAKARDSQAIQEFRQVSLALNLYYSKYNSMPYPAVIASPYTADFNQIAATLVSEGFLSKVPVAPLNHSYRYVNYGAGNVVGALLVTNLEAAEPTSLPYPGTCRPWSGMTNWCDTGRTDTYYCLCHPY